MGAKYNLGESVYVIYYKGLVPYVGMSEIKTIIIDSKCEEVEYILNEYSTCFAKSESALTTIKSKIMDTYSNLILDYEIKARVEAMARITLDIKNSKNNIPNKQSINININHIKPKYNIGDQVSFIKSNQEYCGTINVVYYFTNDVVYKIINNGIEYSWWIREQDVKMSDGGNI